MRLIILLACLLCSAAQAAHNQLADRSASSPEYQSEWWQLTANLADRDGRIWNLEWSLYRQHVGLQAASDTPRTGKMSLAHVAITTPDGEYYEQRFEHGAIMQAGATSPRQILDDGDATAGWEWVSQGEELFPARLSFSIADRDLILLLESIGPHSAATEPASVAIDHAASDPLIRVRGFVDRGSKKTYLRGQGRLDREWQTPLLAGNLASDDRLAR